MPAFRKLVGWQSQEMSIVTNMLDKVFSKLVIQHSPTSSRWKWFINESQVPSDYFPIRRFGPMTYTAGVINRIYMLHKVKLLCTKGQTIYRYTACKYSLRVKCKLGISDNMICIIITHLRCFKILREHSRLPLLTLAHFGLDNHFRSIRRGL